MRFVDMDLEHGDVDIENDGGDDDVDSAAEHRGDGGRVTNHELERKMSSFWDGDYGGNGGGDNNVRELPLHSRSIVNNTSHIAIIGANVSQIESLDSEHFEKDLLKQGWRSRKKVQIVQYVFLNWGLALLIGLSTGLVAFFNNLVIENIAGLKLLLTNKLMLQHSACLTAAPPSRCLVVG